MTLPWTHEELHAWKQKLQASIQTTESERPNIRPLPPMEEDEAREMLVALADTACTRKLTEDESFLIGQLLSCYRMAILAKKLGKPPGRYFVFSEAELVRLQQAMNHECVPTATTGAQKPA